MVDPSVADQFANVPVLGALMSIWSPSTWALSVDTQCREYVKYVPVNADASSRLTSAMATSATFAERFDLLDPCGARFVISEPSV
jgi:hypothetical protein